MSGPIAATGAQGSPTRYGALGMGARQFTGLVTQRSPFRDGAVPYLVGKFYGGTRFDTIWDGLNREISQKLTDVRAPGSAVWNANDFPASYGMYPWKYIQNGAEKIQAIYDGVDGTIYDASNGGKSTIYAKGAGAGPARFLNVNTELFFCDKVENKKVIGTSKIWQATTQYNAGDLILDTNGNLQQAFSTPLVRGILSVQYFVGTDANGSTSYWVQVVLDDNMDFPSGSTSYASCQITLSGLTTATWLNGSTVSEVAPVGTNGNTFIGVSSISAHADYGPEPDTGNATGIRITDDEVTNYLGTSGAAQPTWATGRQQLTVDGTLTWACYGNPVKAWGLATPTTKPTVYANYNTETYWLPNTFYDQYQAIIDSNGQIEVVFNSTSVYLTSFTEPTWNTSVGGYTQDGTIAWANCGQAGPWYASSVYGYFQSILDSNGNIQVCTTVNAAQYTSGTSAPAWGTNLGDTVADGGISWVCCGAGTTLASASIQYSYCFHSIDGSVSNAAPANVTIINGVLGTTAGATGGGFSMRLSGPSPTHVGYTADQISQIDQVWLMRTPQGQPTLINLMQMPVDQVDDWVFDDLLPDTQLNAFIAAPINQQNNPPLVGMTAPVYYLQRDWGIYQNMVVYSGGPDTLVGNGNTAWPPLNFIPFPAQPIRLLPIGIQGGGLVVMTTSGIQIILGTGTTSDPFYVANYFQLVSVLGYNAVAVFYNQIFCMESNGKVSSLAIEYPFNPQTGYQEIGFPIGDQFVKTTTGGMNAALFNPATAFLTWNANSSADTGMYLSDNAGDWFRLSLINPPESGMLWSPLRTIQGGASAVQSVETSPGVHQLLIAPPAGGTGPILVRDTTGTVWTDNGTPYPSWDAKGVTLLCSTGQWAEVAHISTKSTAVGARPTISVLFNEIYPTPQRPYAALTLPKKSNDPPRNRKSVTVYSDRYLLAQNGRQRTGDSLLTKFDYGTQAFGDELLDWNIFATVHDERQEAAAKA